MPKLLYVDVTTSWAEAGRHAHGTTRTERGIVEAMAALGRPDIRFTRFDAPSGVFVPVSADEAVAVAKARPAADVRREPRSARSGAVRKVGLALEAWFRFRIRTPWRRWRARLAAERLVAPMAGAGALSSARASSLPFEPGSWVLFPGEMNRHDLAALMTLRRRLSLRYAFIFYDLHEVLPAGDPRLADLSATDVPATDFLLRAGSALFSISRYSSGTLAALLRQRGTKGPPILPFRLAGVQQALQEAPVAGLQPGRFVLTVGDLGGRKNQALLFAVWKQLMDQGDGPLLPLVCVGRVTREFTDAVAALRVDPQLRQLIRIETNIDDRQLAWLYRNCRFTVFPSLAEGFGLPVAESLAHGKVCVASTATAIPEAGQGAAIGVDPRARQEWGDIITRLLRDDAFLAEQEGEVARRFHPISWTDSVADILAGIAGLDAGKPGPAT